MASEIGGLLIKLEAENAKLRADLAKAVSSVNSSSTKMNRKLTSIERTSRRVGRAVKSSLAGMVPAFTIAAVTDLAKGAVEATDALAKQARVADISAERLQSLTFAFSQNGIEARETADGLRRMTRRLGEFANSGGGPAKAALDQLNISVRDATGLLRPTEAVLDDVIAALAGVDSQARRSALAAQLFGDDAGPKLSLAVGKGVEALRDQEQQARDLGLVLENELVAKAEDAADKMDILNRRISTEFSRAVLENVDSVEQVSSGLIKLGSFVVDIGAKFDEVFNFAAVRREAAELANDVKSLFSDVTSGAQSANDALDAFNGKITAALTNRGDISNAGRVFDLDALTGRADAALADRGDISGSLEAIQVIEDMAAETRGLNIHLKATKRNLDTLAPPQGLFDTFLDEVTDLNQALEIAGIQGLRALEDSIVDVIQTGKLNFKDLADFAIQQLLRIAIRQAILKPLGNALGGLFGGFKAEGGPVAAGKAYVVGEEGPELFVPGASGQIIPNNGVPAAAPPSAGAGQALHFTFNNVTAADREAIRTSVLVDVLPVLQGGIAGARRRSVRPAQ